MAARIKLVYPPKNDSIMIEIQQHNKIEDILRRVVNFWIEDGDLENYVLLNEDKTLDKRKTVHEAGIVGGDELKLVGKARLESVNNHDENMIEDQNSDVIEDSSNGEQVEINKDKRINVAENWLEKNIGVNRESLTMVEFNIDQNDSKIVFSDKENDCFYTLEMENENVIRYIPIYENKEVD